PSRPASATVIAFFFIVCECKSERLSWQVIFAFYSLVDTQVIIFTTAFTLRVREPPAEKLRDEV
ncbi:MAG: hypothetical protein V3S55_00255, partial [Nitrospiraceae bacterium]